MKVTKEYIEQYAHLSLIHCYDDRLTLLRDREEMDWQSIVRHWNESYRGIGTKGQPETFCYQSIFWERSVG